MDEENLMGKVVVESFWGAIAAFVLLQIFGYVILQAFLISIDAININNYFPAIFQIILGLAFIISFLLFQSISISKIKNYLFDSSKKPFKLLKEREEFIKFLLLFFFIVCLILIYLGYYPLPRKEESFYLIIFFYILSWFVSFVLLIIRKTKTPFVIAKGFNRLVGIVVGFVFFILALILERLVLPDSLDFFKQFSLFLGMIGLGIVIMLCCSILMEDQLKK